jgi:hypothetical protein
MTVKAMLDLGPNLRTIAAKVAERSRKKSRKIAEGRGRSQIQERRFHMNQIFAINSGNFDLSIKSTAKSQTKVAEGRGRSHKVAQYRMQPGDLQVPAG